MSKKKRESSLETFYYNYKILIWIIIAIIAVILIVKLMNRDNEKPVVPVNNTSIVIEDKDNLTVGIGNSIHVKATVNVDNAPIINWSSSNPSIATVIDGSVTGVNYGTTTITATYIDNTGIKYYDTAFVTVVEGDPTVKLIDISFPTGDLYMPVNGEYKLNLMLNPANALVNDKMFVSTNESILSVSNDGVVKAHKEGTASVIARINGVYQTAINVYVNNKISKSEILISPTSISFNTDSRKIKVGSSEKLNYSTIPSNADHSKLTFSSNEPSIVSVDANGVITGKSEGETIVTVKTINGETADIIVEVYSSIVPVEDIVIDTSTINMEAGTTKDISPVIKPSNASNQGLSYSSGDPSIVSVSVSGNGSTATLSALKKGSTTIVISSGKIEKRVIVNVTGDGNNSEMDEDGTNLETTIKVRSNKNNLAKTYEEAKKIPVPGNTSISVTMSIGIGKIKYCYNKYGSSLCKPDKEMYADGNITIPGGAMYVLRIIKYDYKGKEISSKSVNYVDGVLNYYINTTDNSKLYTVTGAYTTALAAKATPSRIGDIVSIRINDSDRHIFVCTATDTSCTPDIRINSYYTYTINKEGTTRIYVSEYDSSNRKIGNTEIYYVYVESNLSNQISASGLGVYYNSSIGNYLSVNVKADLDFSSMRFCYKVVNKGASGTCNLDLNSYSVPVHDGTTYFHSKEELKTYYGTFTTVKNKTLLFDLDELERFFNDNDTNKDVILEFAVRSTKGYFDTIKVRINMTRKSGTNSYWSTSFVK